MLTRPLIALLLASGLDAFGQVGIMNRMFSADSRHEPEIDYASDLGKILGVYDNFLERIAANQVSPPVAIWKIACAHRVAMKFAARQDRFSAQRYGVAFASAMEELQPAHGEDPSQTTGDWREDAKLKYRATQEAVRLKLRHLYAIEPDSLARFEDSRLSESDLGDGAASPSPYAAPGRWQRTPPSHGEILTNWNHVRPWVASTQALAARYHFPANLRDPNDPEVLEVHAVGGRTSSTRTEEQTKIARFWAGSHGPHLGEQATATDYIDKGRSGSITPPGIWMEAGIQMALKRQPSARGAAILLGTMAVAMSDAGVAAWTVKNRDRGWRPYTAIQTFDPAWDPLLETPPFPGYVSGHSTFSAAASVVLNSLAPLRPDETFLVHVEVPLAYRKRFGISRPEDAHWDRTFAGYADAAQEAGRSRIYGGIHLQSDNIDGLRLGAGVACESLRALRLPCAPIAY